MGNVKWHKYVTYRWTVEYGLIGTVENPKIYGAGYSSIGESAYCMTDKASKRPYDIAAAYQS
jgi:phenylalanine-4-hydroxylase